MKAVARELYLELKQRRAAAAAAKEAAFEVRETRPDPMLRVESVGQCRVR